MDGQRLSQPLRLSEVEPAALANLSVHANAAVLEQLRSVHTEVESAVLGVSGQDEGQRHERSAVPCPGGQGGERGEVRRAIDDLGHGAAPASLESNPSQGGDQGPLGPELLWRGREGLLGEGSDALDHGLGPVTEGELDSAGRAEEVCHRREGCAAGALEEHGRPPCGDDPPVDLGHLEPGVDLCLDLHELTLRPQAVQEGG